MSYIHSSEHIGLKLERTCFSFSYKRKKQSMYVKKPIKLKTMKSNLNSLTCHVVLISVLCLKIIQFNFKLRADKIISWILELHALSITKTIWKVKFVNATRPLLRLFAFKSWVSSTDFDGVFIQLISTDYKRDFKTFTFKIISNIGVYER